MKYKKFLTDLKWTGKRIADEKSVFIGIEQISDYLREDPEVVEQYAEQGCFGIGIDRKYDLYEVISYSLGLDRQAKTAIKFFLLSYTDFRKMKKRKNITLTLRKDKGIYQAYAQVGPTSKDRKCCYNKDPKVVLEKVRKLEYEYHQKTLLKVAIDTTPEELEALDRKIEQHEREMTDIQVLQAESVTEEIKTNKRKTKKTATVVEVKQEEVGEERAFTTGTAVPTFGEAFIMWMKSRREDGEVTERTLAFDRQKYDKYFEEWFISKRVDEITTKDATKLLKSILKKYELTQVCFDSPVRILFNTMKFIRVADGYEHLTFKFEEEKVGSKKKPMRKHLDKSKREEETALTNEQIRIILEAINDKIASPRTRKKMKYFLIKLNFYLGLRVGELAALQIDDIDLVNNIIHIRRGEVVERELDDNMEYTGKLRKKVVDPKTQNGIRDLPIIDEARAVIEEIFAYRKKKGYQSKKLAYDGVDCNGKKVMYMRDAITGGYSVIQEMTGIKFHCHLQRKTFATRLVNSNVPTASIQKLMGHSSIQTTLQCYVLPQSDYMKQAQEVLQSVFGTKNCTKDETPE